MKLLPVFTILLLLLLVTCPAGAQHKYDLKSGVITFENVIQSGKMQIKKTCIVSFDDFGRKERKDTYEGKTLVESYFSNGDSLYTVKPVQKTAYLRGPAYRGTELRFDWSEISAGDKKEGKAKMLPGMSVAGKKCDSYQVVSGKTTSVFAGWNHICLYSDVTFMGMKTTAKALKLVENASIPTGTFSIPQGYAIVR